MVCGECGSRVDVKIIMQEECSNATNGLEITKWTRSMVDNHQTKLVRLPGCCIFEWIKWVLFLALRRFLIVFELICFCFVNPVSLGLTQS